MRGHTHPEIDPALCGVPSVLEPGHAEVTLSTTANMAADARGLVHGGFVFGAVDYAAMLAVDDPHVVLGAAEVRFTAPVEVGEAVVCVARRLEQSGRKHTIEVRAAVGERVVLEGTLTAFVLDQHVLDR